MFVREHDRYFNEFTGIVSGFRRRGIAQALKIKTRLYAKDSGAAEILTENAPMLVVSRKLGYFPALAHALLVNSSGSP